MIPARRVFFIACLASNFAFASKSAADEELAPPRLVKAWSSQLKQEYGADGVCVRDGSIYLGTGGAEPVIAKLGVADGAGQIRWKTRLGEKLWSRPCVLDDRAYVGAYDVFLYGVDLADGEIKTKIDCGGRIKYDPVASHGLIFLAADGQRPPAEFDINKERRELLVVDPGQGEIVSKFHSDSRFGPTIFEQDGTLYFHDARHLYAYDATKRKLRWKVAAPPNMKPFPIFQGDRIVLAMNVMGRDGQHEPLVAVIDRATGKELSRSSTGGIGIVDFGHYRQVGDMLLTTDHRMTCYKIANRTQGD